LTIVFCVKWRRADLWIAFTDKAMFGSGDLAER
jgi:hypothetical protein